MLVMLVGAQTIIFGRDMTPLTFNFDINRDNIASVISKSEITPSFSGRTALILPGVRPTIW